MQPSILRSVIRPFLATFFGMMGIFVGILMIVALISALFNDTTQELKAKSHYSPTIVANAERSREEVSAKAPVILKLNISGIIGTEKLNMHSLNTQLIESREGVLKDDRVKAILVHINTPGGTVVDSDGIYRALMAYKKHYEVPIYAYIDGLCASGGMYISSACDKVFASESSLIGSVGVISPAFFNATELMEKIGLETKVLSAGKGKDNLNPFRKWEPGEENMFKGIIDYYYNQFVDIVVSARPELKRTRLINEYGAQIFPASKAKEYGFIDQSGISLDDTLKLLANQIGVDDNYYQVVKMDRKIDFSDLFSNGSMLLQGKVKHQIELSPGLDANLMNQYLYLYLPNTQ